MQRGDVIAPDGVRLATYAGGNPNGPAILFIHGFSQCALAWAGQFSAPRLADDYHLLAFDLRGHGASDKPADLSRYADDQTFADDVHAVITAFGRPRPVLVGWSYAGRVVGDYVAAYGTAGIAGINYVCARTNNDNAFRGPGTDHLAAMTGDDLAANIRATRAFLRACYEVQPDSAAFETALAYNMLIPAPIRAAHLGRPPSDGAIIASLDVPVLVTQGSEDQLVLRGLAEWTARQAPSAQLSIYEGIGHSPFVEDRTRYNRELAAFVRAAQSA